MHRGKSRFFRLEGLLLLGLLPSVSASVPVLDTMPKDGRIGVESHHHPGTHGFPHNHLICIQQAASHWVEAEGTPPAPQAVEIQLPPSPDAPGPIHSARPHLPHSRAPPGI